MTEETITPNLRIGKKKSGEIYRFQRFMQLNNLKVEDIHKVTGVSSRTITHCLYEQNPLGVKLLRGLHQFYGVSLDWLLSGHGHMLISDRGQISEEPGGYQQDEPPRVDRIVSTIKDWMTYASTDEQAWLETELKFKISQHKQYLKERQGNQGEL